MSASQVDTDNPYWREVSLLPRDTWDGGIDYVPRSGQPYRTDLTKKYAWAIPDPDSLAFIVEQLAGRDVVEIGAGNGYWAWQLAQLGVDVVAFDQHTNLVDNKYFADDGRMFHDVRQGGPESAADHPDRALFLCWPTMSDCAEKSLAAYKGDLLVYIGECHGGCTADDEFFDLLESEWEQVARHSVVQYAGIHDYVEVYRRAVQS